MTTFYLVRLLYGSLIGHGWVLISLNCLLIIFILLIFLTSTIRIINIYKLRSKPLTILEIALPSRPTDGYADSSNLLQVLFSLIQPDSLVEKLFRPTQAFALELVASGSEGLRFTVRLPDQLVNNFKRALRSYEPNLTVKKANDYLSTDKLTVKDFKLKNSPIYSLNTELKSSEDLASYILGSMAGLSSKELVCLQLALKPASPFRRWRLSHQSQNKSTVHASRPKSLIGLAQYLYHYNKQPNKSNETKLSSTLLKARIRLIMASSSLAKTSERIKAVSSALAVFDSQKQALILRRKTITLGSPSLLTWIGPGSILSVKELAAIYHFPNSQYVGLKQQPLKYLALPVGLRSSSRFDVIFGETNYPDEKLPIGLTIEDRKRHTLIVGATGSGKSTLLKGSIISDIKSGKGIGLLDPHGDLAESLLSYIPKNRIKDVIYFNGSDISHPIGLNLLELPGSSNEDSLRLDKDFMVESVVSILRKQFSSNEANSHRLDYILRNAIESSLYVKNATLFTVYRLLTDARYRQRVINSIDDQALINFWQNEFNAAGGMQRVKMSIGLTSKLGRFLRSSATRRILAQPKSTIDFDDLINNGKILICNFSKGRLGEDTARLLGMTVLTKLQLAALRRQSLAENKRRPFYLYVDEFQHYASNSFAEMMSEARKYGLNLILAEQSLSQQDDARLVSTILANSGSLICFRTSSPSDEKLLLPYFSPPLSKGDLMNLPAYNFYVKIAAKDSYLPFSGVTKLTKAPNQTTAKAIIESSRRLYSYKGLVAYIMK